jgi:DNA-binding transcriptional ArsR family regulator
MPDGARGVGRALLEAIDREGPGEDLDIQGPSLANARRRQVFQFLCVRPCARVGDMCRVLSLSQATVRWHERNLLENAYVEMEANRMFPQGLIDAGDASLFVLLTAPGRSAVFRAAVDDPGVSLQEVGARIGMTRQSASKIATELAEASLATIVEDGRFRRVYPTTVLRTKREGNRPRAHAFVDRLVRRLDDDGLRPELLRRDEAFALLRFGLSSRTVVMDVSLDPYLTAWHSAP